MEDRSRFVLGAAVIALVILPFRLGVTSPSRLVAGEPAAAPFAHTKFCLNYPSECQEKPNNGLSKNGALTPQRRAELETVNLAVNREIAPQEQPKDPANEQWIINPMSGDCNDYAVTKRHNLITKGWPEDALLLTEVELPTGEHHLVVVARTSEGDIVMDNLHPKLRTGRARL